jgi:hypothetical protein
LLSSSQETRTKRGWAHAGGDQRIPTTCPGFSGNSDDETTLPKTDSDVDGATAIPAGAEEQSCPVSALRRWLESAAIGDGRISTESIAMDTSTLLDSSLAEVVATRTAAAGLDRSARMPQRRRPSGHRELRGIAS